MKDDRRNLPFIAKRKVLVAEDEEINREILGMILGDDYEVLYAENGVQALEILRANAETLSIALLDVIMPEMDGMTLLETMKADPELEHIPVIVLTSEKAFEVKCLRLGASDFIKKPYDLPEVILARVERTIELYEDAMTISKTEFDQLTGIYNQEYFFRYVAQYDSHNPKAEMDAVVADIEHFRMYNELYGREVGNELLKNLAAELNGFAERCGGLACRKGGDIFMLYCPHIENYDGLEEELVSALKHEKVHTEAKVRLGVYPKADRSVDIRTRFDRAKLAADSVKNNFAKCVALYDDAMHKKTMLDQQLLSELDEALESKQFRVYFQPKYNISGDKPVLSSAEALIRWHHPQMGVIPPGMFIPLFEANGLIPRLDRFVWAESAAQIREWRDRYGFTLPVSVNVSRVDMYDPNLMQLFIGLIEKNGLNREDLLLEVTESAYTDNADQIISLVEKLREAGFKIEMDDFGSGYSSLNMLSKMPIDALKLDMYFIRNIFKNEKNIHILKLMMEIKDFLKVPVVAEGVETKEQLDVLKGMGCDVIQGYYFSAPVPPEKFEKFIEERIK